MNTITEHSAAAFSKVADQETNDLRLYNDDFLNSLQVLAKFKDRAHKTHHSGEWAEAVDAAEVETAEQKIAMIALGAGDVDRAASRVVDEVAATEMARVIVGLWNVHLNICQKKNQSFAVLLFSPLPGPFSVRRFCHLWICDAGCIVRDISGAQPCQRTEFQPCNSATSCGLHVMIGCSAPTGALACIIFDHYPSQAGTVIITYDID
ncbi:hypothetical protein AA0112_g12030 [Alternaria arborescens]|jgi:hypothetical protein|uniref:Uncharacterized protein n=1 Tax=Alternaria tenuissima TaxID=119927 RepID=A0ABY0FR39_9PLEO|nr:hypothetical protein AA0112_g12030 [Alternaria arborescens]RYN87293.1 hypothetical protein AA0119_g12510 [Alternaria tenuissima]RYO04358.1 hypothetical protein AA0121_g12853 [Alternaria tenuissima]RYO63065.1 hypothetical protein AA0116_g5188 [Alternaria tenuissima]